MFLMLKILIGLDEYNWIPPKHKKGWLSRIIFVKILLRYYGIIVYNLSHIKFLFNFLIWPLMTLQTDGVKALIFLVGNFYPPENVQFWIGR